MQWLFLLIAILSETTATSALKATNGFKNLVPSIITAVGYITAFYFLSLAVKTIPVAVVYAIWAGLGIVLITLVSWLLFKQTLDVWAITGIAFIIAGVVIMYVFSKSVSH
ncbi:MAG: multidrug efflux SMR transporter [Chitinivibrionia bacterium]|jgi:small multidrug resistance pump|nr:multidrug efflux SMR transporter [Chitinivibrionia bacterium]